MPQTQTPTLQPNLRLYNTLTRRVEDFAPQDPARVTLYVCGPTVYGYVHIGNARTFLVFDLLARTLKRHFPQVVYTRNITDIDDKINAAAREQSVPIGAITARFGPAFDEDMAALGLLAPDIVPHATAHIPQIVTMIEQLIASGHAYAAEGHVLFSVASFPAYGKLSRREPDEMLAGARVEIAPYKRNAGDFVLWKPSTGEPGSSPQQALPGWDSPWSHGRPGWHIECSAMAAAHLGTTLDIHGGGMDLQFPHHENEIAQSEGAHGHVFVNYWMHNGFVRVDNEKMSKSLGNFFTVREVLARYDAEVVRFFIARAHYRSPLNYSDQHLDDAKGALTRLYTALKAVPANAGDIDWTQPHAARFREAMNDDFNTPEAVAVLFDLANEVNRSKSKPAASKLKSLAAVLGLLQQEPDEFLQGGPGATLTDEQVSEQIAARLFARKQKNYAESDRIRAELDKAGVILEDTPGGGTTWRRR